MKYLPLIVSIIGLSFSLFFYLSNADLSDRIKLQNQRIGVLDTVIHAQDAKIDSLCSVYNQDYYYTKRDMDTLYKMAYKGRDMAKDLDKWERRGERVKAFRKGFLGF